MKIIRENKLISKERTLNSKIDYTFQDFLLPYNGVITVFLAVKEFKW